MSILQRIKLEQSTRKRLVILAGAAFVLIALAIITVLVSGLPNVPAKRPDSTEDTTWLRKATDLGLRDDALYFCETQQIEQPNTFVLCLKEFAKSGDIVAAARLGESYYLGDRVEKDLDVAYRWLKPAAERGHATSQFYLGWLYDNGLAVTKNAELAIEWYQRAALQDVPSAHWNLAITYEYGPQELRSRTRAFSHYLNAADLGYDEAFLKVGKALFFGRGTQPDIQGALLWFERAAQAGYPEAMRLMSLIYFEGSGGPPDFLEAYKWALLYRGSVTSELSRRQAETAMDLMRSRLDDDEIADAQHKFKKWRAGSVGGARGGIILGVTPPRVGEMGLGGSDGKREGGDAGVTIDRGGSAEEGVRGLEFNPPNTVNEARPPPPSFGSSSSEELNNPESGVWVPAD